MSDNGFKEFQFENYTIRQLGINDHELLQGLCERCTGNNNIIVGSSQEKNIGLGILKELPPGKTAEDKIVMGIFEAASLIGVLDMVKDFPVKGELILGLLMFDPVTTGRGLRGKTHKCVIDWATNLHFDKLRIDVAGDNLESYEFWKNIGYTETKRVKLKLGSKEKEIVIMNYQL